MGGSGPLVPRPDVVPAVSRATPSPSLASLPDMTDLVTLRAATLDDIPAAADVRASVESDLVITAEGMVTWVANLPADADVFLLAAEAEGRMVGWCNAWRDVFGGGRDIGFIDVVVVADHQRQGLGTQLLTRGLAHVGEIGVGTVRASSVDGPAQRAICDRFGFAERHASSTSALDPRTVDPLPVPEGVVLTSFGEIDDPRPLYELDLEVSRDIPGDESLDAMTFEQWSVRFWHSVFADDEASLAAYVDGELAALTMLRVDRPSARAFNNITGTRRAYRGRGLARLLKTHSLQRAAAAGATIAFTNNDETNAPMLAVNHALGYRHSTRRIEWERGTATG
jgi:GNAT superfamily N-acetyltransferase